jgi:predicted nucleic acid-binding protein
VLAAALDTGLTAYDTSYLVVAEQSGAVIVTADRRLAVAYPRSALLPDVGPEDVFGQPGQGD